MNDESLAVAMTCVLRSGALVRVMQRTGRVCPTLNNVQRVMEERRCDDQGGGKEGREEAIWGKRIDAKEGREGRREVI